MTRIGAACIVVLALAWYAISQHRTGVWESRPVRAATGSTAEGHAAVQIGTATLDLEVAADWRTQHRGLGGRDSIHPDGGMIFVYPSPRPLTFVMRDCRVPIDIAFLDIEGRVISVHTMEPEPSRRSGESASAYEARLRRYASPLPAQFAIETAGGRLHELGLRSGHLVELDRRALLRALPVPGRPVR